MFALAKEKKLFAMEALWSRFLPSYEFVFDQISKGVIGDIYHVSATLGFKVADVTRVATKEMGGGTVLDLGVYVINIAEQVFVGETPEKVLAVGHLNKNGVDLDFTAAVQYKNNRTAALSTHSMVELPNEAIIVGSKGTIRVSFVMINDVIIECLFPLDWGQFSGGDQSLRQQPVA